MRIQTAGGTVDKEVVRTFFLAALLQRWKGWMSSNSWRRNYVQREENSQPCVLKANQEKKRKKYDWKMYVFCVHAWGFHLLFLKTPQSSQTSTVSQCLHANIYLGPKQNVRWRAALKAIVKLNMKMLSLFTQPFCFEPVGLWLALFCVCFTKGDCITSWNTFVFVCVCVWVKVYMVYEAQMCIMT